MVKRTRSWISKNDPHTKAQRHKDKKQVLTYLKLTDMKLGYLLNFGEELMKDGIFRIINGHIE